MREQPSSRRVSSRGIRTTAVVAVVALAVTSVLGWWLAIPSASAATRVDYHSGMLNCSGDLIVMVQNMTRSPLDATVTARALNGLVVSPSSGDAELSNIPAKSTEFVQYDCTGGANRAIQIRTTSTSAIPAVQFTNIGGGTQTISAGGWQVKVRR